MPSAPSSLCSQPRTKKDAYVSASVAFEDVCVGAFTDGVGLLSNGNNVKSAVGKGSGGGSLAPWGTRTMAAPVDLIVAGDVIVVAIVVVVIVVSHNLAAKGGVSVAIPPQSLSLPT